MRIKLTVKTVKNIARPVLLAAALAIPMSAYGAVYGGGGILDGIAAAAGLGGITEIDSILDLILMIIAFILDFALLLAVLAIIIAGLYLITSQGDEGQKDKAKKIIFYAIIGIIVILFSRLIVVLINNIFS